MGSSIEPNVSELNLTDAESEHNKYQALLRLIRRGQGRFVFAFVDYDTFETAQTVIRKIQTDLPEFNIVTIELPPFPVDVPKGYHILHFLPELVQNASPAKPDALLLTGLENLFPENLEIEDQNFFNSMLRAIGPLNAGRPSVAREFPYPFFLFLTPPMLRVFLNYAPDLSSWRSGSFQFQTSTPMEQLRKSPENEEKHPVECYLVSPSSEDYMKPTIEDMRQFLGSTNSFANPSQKHCITELLRILEQQEERAKMEAGIIIHEASDRVLHYDLGNQETAFRVGKNWDTQSVFIGVGPYGDKYSLADFKKFLTAGGMALRAAKERDESSRP